MYALRNPNRAATAAGPWRSIISISVMPCHVAHCYAAAQALLLAVLSLQPAACRVAAGGVMIDGPEIRARRLAVGMTADQLGAKAGMSGAYVRQIETGARPGSVKALRALAKVLGLGSPAPAVSGYAPRPQLARLDGEAVQVAPVSAMDAAAAGSDMAAAASPRAVTAGRAVALSRVLSFSDCDYVPGGSPDGLRVCSKTRRIGCAGSFSGDLPAGRAWLAQAIGMAIYASEAFGQFYRVPGARFNGAVNQCAQRVSRHFAGGLLMPTAAMVAHIAAIGESGRPADVGELASHFGAPRDLVVLRLATLLPTIVLRTS